MPEWSKTWTYYDGRWREGNEAILGPRDHAFWLASSVFDGARAFEGVTPDLDLHCARVNRSASALCLKPVMQAGTIVELAREGVAKFPSGAELYIRPMYFARGGAFGTSVPPDAETTEFCLSVYEAPMPGPDGSAVTLSPFRRPTLETMPVNAKAGCLYPNNGRALIEARSRGFQNCLLTDMLGNVAELATANVFIAKDGVVATPVANGTFLAGVTRSRVIELLRRAGVDVRETTLDLRAFAEADEVFTAGNFGKVTPVTRFEAREMQPGPFFRQARALYWDYAHQAA